MELINKLEIILEEASDKTLNILFWLEATEIYTGLYSNYTRAQDSLQKVLGKLGLDIYFSGKYSLINPRFKLSTRMK